MPLNDEGVPVISAAVLAAKIQRLVDLDRCERDDPCAYDHTCRIHKIRAFLRDSIVTGELPPWPEYVPNAPLPSLPGEGKTEKS